MEKTIGKYKILREIGRGGMAIVYKALDTGRQRTVALKVLLPSMVDRSAVERFNREAQAMARLRHPHILEVYEFGITRGEHYFAMEFIEGESLKDIIKRKGPLSVEESLEIISQVGQALAYAHREGMIHRDIKPGNIMIDKKGQVKVMDFGLVQIPGVTRVTTEGSTVGTAEYMSPEQISDQEVDSRTDIYSLGVTIYEMLIGRPPFVGDTFQAVLMKHKYEAPPALRESNPQIPQELGDITAKAMAKDVAQRYQKVEELLADINRLKGIEPLGKKKTPLFKQKAEMKPKKKKLPVLLIGILIFSLVIGFGYVNREELSLFLSKLGYRIKTGLTKKTDLTGETERILKRFEMADEHHSLGLKFYRDGSVNQAISEHKKAVSLRPDYPLYYRDLALAYERKEEKRRAIKAWEDLLRYDQTGPDAELAREHLKKLKSQ